jgi:hypothetical protein
MDGQDASNPSFVQMPPQRQETLEVPPVLMESLCLLPGDPVVRIERVPGNAVRIFAGMDIEAPMQSVWDVLTDHENLHKVVPSLVHNEVLQRHADGGVRMVQTGAATVVPGIAQLHAKMVVDVKTHYKDSQLLEPIDIMLNKFDSRQPPIRGIFPRSFAVNWLPYREITIQNVEGRPGPFDLYQGVWRVQPLPGCARKGREMSRLTYVVEIKPKGLLPIKLIENRIAADLETNLMAVRDWVKMNVETGWTI